MDLGGGRFLAGALRVEGTLRAAPPFPASPLIDAAPIPEGWRFTARDGTLFTASTFTAPLRVAGLLPPPNDTPWPNAPAGAREADALFARMLPDHLRAPLPLPERADAACARRDGDVEVLRGDEILRHDARTGRIVRRAPAPGTACVLYRGRLGTRAVCTHQGWARAVFAEERGWAAIRDELHAEPMGELAFDDRTEAWAVGAPCDQQPAPAGNRGCVYTREGRRVELSLPFDGSPVSAHDGAVFFAEFARESSTTEAAVWQEGRLTPLTLPVPPAAARTARWEGSSLVLADGATFVRVLGVREGRPRATRLAAPPGARLVLGEGVHFAVSREGVWRLTGSRFTRLALPVSGSAAPLDFARGEGWCAGAWCRLSETVYWSAAGAVPWGVIAHPEAYAWPAS